MEKRYGPSSFAQEWCVHAAASADVHTMRFRCAQLEFLSALSWKVIFGQGRWQKLQVLIVGRRRLEVARCWHELESERWSDTETVRLALDEERVGAHRLDRRRCGKEVSPHMFRKFHVDPFTDFYESALWTLSCVTHTKYPNHCFALGSHVSALFQIPTSPWT